MATPWETMLDTGSSGCTNPVIIHSMVAAAKASLLLLVTYLNSIQQLISRHDNIQRAHSGLRSGCSSAASRAAITTPTDTHSLPSPLYRMI